jgi:opacity protein-like surface antigen
MKRFLAAASALAILAAASQAQAAEVARSGELAKVEKQLRAQNNGDDVKIAFDPLANQYMALRPGQPGYDQVKSAEDVFTQVIKDLPKIGNINDFRDVLAQYGVAV